MRRRGQRVPVQTRLSADQRKKVAELGVRWGQHDIEENGPVTFIGSGVNLNAGIGIGHLVREKYQLA
ncbi:hypothetical protein C9I56_20350 [Paraburkholderia caribensis]|uniref:Uncharacterized protein n=1 Tax=Paraburkholderia caribensis TaxID=75105 RepID=A0A9Q6WRE7_9BURK|nr:hypothetical protein C9I56_20350 [Paraburkholderia caribensis]QLB67606.1 hypothetical protein A9O66_34955 [Paraburkholderia caribensis]